MLDEGSAGIELDRTREMVRDAAEVRAGIREEVDPGGKQEQSTERALYRDQPEETVTTVDRASLSMAARLR
jgi:hypothetical protein